MSDIVEDGPGRAPGFLGLPDNRKAAVTYGLEQYQHMAAERDEIEKENRELRIRIAEYKIVSEAQNAQILELENRVKELTLVRDQAVADRVVYESLFVSIKAMLRAFAVPNAPLIKDKSEEADRALETQTESAKRQINEQKNKQPYDDWEEQPENRQFIDNRRKPVIDDRDKRRDVPVPERSA